MYINPYKEGGRIIKASLKLTESEKETLLKRANYLGVSQNSIILLHLFSLDIASYSKLSEEASLLHRKQMKNLSKLVINIPDTFAERFMRINRYYFTVNELCSYLLSLSLKDKNGIYIEESLEKEKVKKSTYKIKESTYKFLDNVSSRTGITQSTLINAAIADLKPNDELLRSKEEETYTLNTRLTEKLTAKLTDLKKVLDMPSNGELLDRKLVEFLRTNFHFL